MTKEPILFLVLGGSALIQGIVQLARAFGAPITEPEEVAIYSLWSVVIAVLGRMMSVPVASLPAGTLDKINTEKTANAKP